MFFIVRDQSRHKSNHEIISVKIEKRQNIERSFLQMFMRQKRFESGFDAPVYRFVFFESALCEICF